MNHNDIIKKFLLQIMRKASYRWPARNIAKGRARIARGLYKCEKCGFEGKSDEIQLDHIHPVIDPLVGWNGWDSYITRLFCPPEGYQVLCLACHDTKSKIENQIRKEQRQKKKALDKLSKKK